MKCISVVILLGAAAAQNLLPVQLAGEGLEIAKASKAADFWKSKSQEVEHELEEVLGGSHAAEKQAGMVGLTACLRSRDVVQMEVEKLQRATNELKAEVDDAKTLQSTVAQGQLNSTTDCQARLSAAQGNSAAQQQKLEQAEAAAQHEHDQTMTNFKSVQSEHEGLSKQVVSLEKEFALEFAKAQKEQELKLVEAKERHEKVMEAHRVLKQAHEVLQKEHEAMQKLEAETQKKQAQGGPPADPKKLKACQQELATAESTHGKIKLTDSTVRETAMKEGESHAESKWAEAIKKATAEKAALIAKVEDAKNKAAAEEAKATGAVQGIPQMETKLRQCRASREKTELSMQRVLQRCPQGKSAFLQLQAQELAFR